MIGDVSRRDFLRYVSAAGVGLGSLGGHAACAQPPASRLSAYQFGANAWVGCDGETIACYRAHATQKYPYIYPFLGPWSGRSLTTESGDPYPHHRSILFACDRVNGANYWQEGLDRGRLVSRGPELEVTEDRVIVRDACDWTQPDGVVDMVDQRTLVFGAPSASLRLLGAQITCVAARPVHIAQTNHSLFALRAARDLTPLAGGTLINSEGALAETDTFGREAKWCAYYGDRFGRIEGIALMDHPDNPWSPCPWFTRDYGFISPTPMNWLGEVGLELAEGETLSLRYLVTGFVGTPEEAGLEDLYSRWVDGALVGAT